MPQTPEDLSRTIKEIARRIAKDKGLFLDRNTLARISRIPPEYSSLRTIDVDLGKLEEMIRDIVELTVKYARTSEGVAFVDESAMETALIEVKCHYLWFC
jgi:hypothetical protein